MEELNQNQETSPIKQWIQDNLRIIISVIVVILIAGGIYSYSERSESPKELENLAIEDISSEDISADEEDEISQKESTETVKQNDNQEKNISSIATSQETEKSFIQTAAKSDSKTTLARAALANFLEKNPDSSLTAEHKIYIEDYLRKKNQHEGGISVGTSLEFQKDVIKEAISGSKNLTPEQLNNLHKYALRVPALS